MREWMRPIRERAQDDNETFTAELMRWCYPRSPPATSAARTASAQVCLKEWNTFLGSSIPTLVRNVAKRFWNTPDI